MTQRSQKRVPKSLIKKVSPEDDSFIRGFVVYEDSDILVFNKPSGLAVQGGSGVTQDMDSLLWAFANRKGRRPKLVHRLDRATSGVMVVAKTSPAAAHLSEQFASRTTIKTYQALCCGAPDTDTGTSESPLLRYVSAGIDLVRACKPEDQGAQAASTSWRVLARYHEASLIEAKPHTGRMHQIRAHMADLGYPIAGDDKYGGLFALSGMLVPRLMLHALSLQFVHPSSGEEVSFTAPLPQDFVSILAGMSQTGGT